MGKLYVGVSSKARKIKKLYVGVNGVARKVKKLYVGVNGIARKVFGGGELKYYTTFSNGVNKVSGAASTTVGNYALFGGGMGNGAATYSVYAYDVSLTKTTLTELYEHSSGLDATTVGNYALFGGGSSSTPHNSVTPYNQSLTRQGSYYLIQKASGLAATTVGDYALFGGGEYLGSNSNYIYLSYVNVFNTSLTRTTTNQGLSVARGELTATTVGNYALFAGGDNTSTDYISTVDAYDTSLTRTIPTSLSVAKTGGSATTVGNYALFGGGATGKTTSRPYKNIYTNVVNAYNTSLTRTIPTSLSEARGGMGSTTVEEYGLFCGGINNSATRVATIDVYDTSLTRTIPTSLSVARNGSSAVTLENYALVYGGAVSSTAYDYSAKVDVYEVS